MTRKSGWAARLPRASSVLLGAGSLLALLIVFNAWTYGDLPPRIEPQESGSLFWLWMAGLVVAVGLILAGGILAAIYARHARTWRPSPPDALSDMLEGDPLVEYGPSGPPPLARELYLEPDESVVALLKAASSSSARPASVTAACWGFPTLVGLDIRWADAAREVLVVDLFLASKSREKLVHVAAQVRVAEGRTKILLLRFTADARD